MSYYEEMLTLGLEYQDFVVDQLYRHGLPIVSYSSQRYQCRVGENKPGFEIKFDRHFRKTGNLYIETAEKRKAEKARFVPSGIYREDNGWLYLIGDYLDIFIFAKRQLKQYFEQMAATLKTVSNATSEGFLLPIAKARPFLVLYEIHLSEEALDDIEYFNERAAILEYEAGYPREDAEREARAMMIARRAVLAKAQAA